MNLELTPANRTRSGDGVRLALEAGGIGTWSLDLASGTVTERTLRHDQLFGHAAFQASWGPDTAQCHIVEDDRRKYVEALAGASGMGTLDVELRVRWPDGGLHWIRMQGRACGDGAGPPLRMEGIVSDITPLKDAEAALAASRQDLRRAQAVAHMGSFALDVQRGVLGWSAETYRIFGVGEDVPLSYEVFMGCIHPDDQAFVAARCKAALDGEPYDIEHRIVVGGEVRWVRERGELDFDAKGEVRGVFGVVQDVTDRKLTEVALRAAEKQHAFLVKLGDALAPLADPLEIQLEACRVLGCDLGASRVLYAETDSTGLSIAGPQYLDGVGPSAERWRMEDYDASLFDQYRRGIAVSCDDVSVRAGLSDAQRAAYAAERIAAWASVPINKPGGPLGRLIVHQAEPRHWTKEEMAEIAETAERVWPAVQRARAEAALRQSERDLMRAQAMAQTGSWRLDGQRNILSWSPETCRIFGIAEETPKTTELYLGTIHPEDRAEVEAKWLAATAGAAFDVEHRIVVNGEVRWIRDRAEFEFGTSGELSGVFGTVQDITERKRAEAILQESQQELKGLHELLTLAQRAAGAGAWDWDIQTDKTTWSAEFYRLFGLDPATATPSVHLWRSCLHPDDVAKTAELMSQAIRERTPYVASYRVILPGGAIRWIDAYGSTSYTKQGMPARFAGICIDITQRVAAESSLRESEERVRMLNVELEAKVEARTAELAAANKALSRLAREDPLTGLPNRLAANERLHTEFIAMKRSRRRYGVLMMDLDEFKRVNDTHGHTVGDDVLQRIAGVLRGSLRESDFVCRYGGEEFLVVLPDTELANARLVAEKIRSSVENAPDPAVGRITISIGVAMATPEQANEDAAVRMADDFLYEAKEAGRNKVVTEAL